MRESRFPFQLSEEIHSLIHSRADVIEQRKNIQHIKVQKTFSSERSKNVPFGNNKIRSKKEDVIDVIDRTSKGRPKQTV